MGKGFTTQWTSLCPWLEKHRPLFLSSVTDEHLDDCQRAWMGHSKKHTAHTFSRLLQGHANDSHSHMTLARNPKDNTTQVHPRIIWLPAHAWHAYCQKALISVLFQFNIFHKLKRRGLRGHQHKTGEDCDRRKVAWFRQTHIPGSLAFRIVFLTVWWQNLIGG